MSVNVWVFYESLPADGGQRDRLSPVEQGVAAVCDLRQEVGSGGFDVYFRYWGGDTAQQAVVVLDAALGAEWSELLRQAMSLLGAGYPTDSDDRFERLEMLNVAAELDAIDKRWFALEAATDADLLLSKYLSQDH